MHLDLKTIAIPLIALEFAVGLITFFAGQNFRHKDRGLTKWGLLTILQSINWGIFHLGPLMPPALPRFLVPTLQIMTLWGYSILLRQFLGKKPHHLIFVSLFGVLFASQFTFIFLIPNEPIRIIFTSIIAAIFAAELVSAVLYRNTDIRFTSHKLLAVTYGTLMVFLLMRLAYFTLYNLDMRHLLIARDQLEAITLLGIALSCTVAAYALLLVYHDRYFELKARAELDREKSETELQMVRDNVPVMIWKLDEHGNIAWSNKAWLNFTGQKIKNLNQSEWLEFVHSDDKSRVLAAVETALNAVRPYHIEYRLRRQDGVFRWVLETGFPLSDSKGKKNGFVGSAMDIHDSKQMEMALIEKEARLRSIFDILPVGLTVLDNDRNITQNNSAMLGILGISEIDLKQNKHLGQKFLNSDQSAIPHEELPSVRALRTGKAVRDVEIGIVHDDSEITWALVSATPLPPPQSGVVVVTLDITDRKKNLQQIEALSAEIFRISESERAQIAGELHDSLGQSLVLASLRLQASLAKIPEISTEERKNILAPVKDALQAARDISHRLSPIHLESLGLKLAIDDLLANVAQSRQYIINAETEALQEIFPGGWNIDLFRIIQEAVTNILKHADADEITILTNTTDSGLALTITDNGSRNAQQRIMKNGLGLLLMQQRAKSFGGKVEFLHADTGFAVRIEIPGQFSANFAV